MRVRGCDRDCDSCALLELCGGIKQYNVKGYSCFEAGCELEFPAIKRMQECSACGIGKLTYDLKDEEVAGLLDEIANLSKVKAQPIELPGVVPIVSLKDPSSYNFDQLKIDAIVVMFEDLFDENIRREVEKTGDIHSYLNFDGKVLVSSIMPDDLITQETVFYFFLGKEEDTDAMQTCLDLYRFYKCAKEGLRIRLADGRVIAAKHGHDIVDGMASAPLDTIAKEMEEARMRAHANWLIIGHLLRAFVDGERKVASTGCWAFGEPYGDRFTRKEDLMTAIVVHGDGEVELKRRC